MIFLKQSTATTVVVGPFVSTTDGYTAKTALTISQAKSLLWKQGGTTFGAKNDATAGTHRSNGCYTLPLDATDTNTLGQLVLSIDDSANAALPVRHDFMVLPANVYDSLVAGSANLAVDSTKIGGSTTAGTNLAASAVGIVTGTSDNTGFTATSTQMDTTITEATTDHYKGRVIVFTSGALAGQATSISAYSLVTGRGRFTFATLTEAVPNSTSFVIV